MSLSLKLRMTPLVIAARRRNRWPRERIALHQKSALQRLVAHARKSSPFYRDLAPGPLTTLPILSRETLYEDWDRIVTDRRLTRDRVTAFLSGGPPPDQMLGGRYRTMATSGSTGIRLPIVYSAQEWAHLMASAARLAHWRGGLRKGGKRLVSVVNSAIGSNAGAPMSWAFAHSLVALGRSIAVLDQSRPLESLIDELNRLKPDALSSFPSTLTLLAEAQLRGELQLNLQSVNSSAEVLSTETALLIERAFGCRPDNAYAMTECGVLAATCSRHSGLHIADDMTLVECVDDAYAPVPPGTEGARVLITVLWSRTLPLIRYDVTDRLRLSDTPCGCSLPFPVLDDIGGRSADLIRVAGRDGPVSILAWQIQRMLYGRGVLSWQLAWSAAELRLFILPDGSGEHAGLIETFQAELSRLGVSPSVAISVKENAEFARGETGKLRRFVPLDANGQQP